jgi:transcriptional regulator with XRE-family HTH domain
MGLTQAQSAQRLGVRQATVSQWENSAYEATLATSKYLTLIAQQARRDRAWEIIAPIVESQGGEAFIKSYCGSLVAEATKRTGMVKTTVLYLKSSKDNWIRVLVHKAWTKAISPEF